MIMPTPLNSHVVLVGSRMTITLALSNYPQKQRKMAIFLRLPTTREKPAKSEESRARPLWRLSSVLQPTAPSPFGSLNPSEDPQAGCTHQAEHANSPLRICPGSLKLSLDCQASCASLQDIGLPSMTIATAVPLLAGFPSCHVSGRPRKPTREGNPCHGSCQPLSRTTKRPWGPCRQRTLKAIRPKLRKHDTKIATR